MLRSHSSSARQAQAIVDGHPGWQYNSKQEAAVRRELYKIVKLETTAVREGESPARAMREVVDNLLRMSRMVGS